MKYSARLMEEIEAINQKIILLKEEIVRLKNDSLTTDRPQSGEQTENGTEDAIAGHIEEVRKLRSLAQGKWRLRASVLVSEKEIAARERKKKREAGLRKQKKERKRPGGGGATS